MRTSSASRTSAVWWKSGATRNCQFSAPLQTLQQQWDEVSWRIARQRDNPACADAEHAAAGQSGDPGLHLHLSFDPAQDLAAPYVHSARPKVAILREQGVNSMSR
jgi:phosphoribosylformylglycinamidine synthase